MLGLPPPPARFCSLLNDPPAPPAPPPFLNERTFWMTRTREKLFLIVIFIEQCLYLGHSKIGAK